MVKAVIFDMDGILINSEPLWRVAMQKSFGKVGLTIEKDTFKETQGLRIDEVVKYWFRKKPWAGMTCEELTEDILDELTVLLLERGQALEGVYDVIALLKAKQVPIAVASSSPHRILDACLTAMKLKDAFPIVCSAEDVAKGKPDPAVFNNAAEALGLPGDECLVFEDSFNGMVSALAAGMKVVAVPETHVYRPERFAAADLVLESLAQFGEEELASFMGASA